MITKQTKLSKRQYSQIVGAIIVGGIVVLLGLLFVSVAQVTAQEPDDWDVWQNPQAIVLHEAGLLTDVNVNQTVQRHSGQELVITLKWAYADIGQVMIGYTIAGLAEQELDDPSAPHVIPEGKLYDSAGNELFLDGPGGIARVPAEDGTITLLRAAGYSLDQFLRVDDPTSVGNGYLAAVYGDSVPASLDLVVQIRLLQVTVDENNYTQEEILPDPAEFALTVPLRPGIVLTPNLTETRQGIAVTLESLRVTPTKTTARICYDLPDQSDWQPQAALRIGEVEGMVTGWGMTDLPTSADVSRCFDMRFDVMHPGDSADATFTLERLQVSVPEAREFWEDVYAALLPLGIEIEVYPHPGSPYRIVRVPDGMDEVEQWQTIQAVVDDLLPTVEGPWVFVVPLRE